MSLLTSLLARDQVVSVRQIEEAIQRQVVSGGELDTVLLEMDATSENVLNAYRAALFDLPPASRQDVMGAPRQATALVPCAVAERYRLCPVGASMHNLTVVVATPLAPEVVRELSFLLGRQVRMRVVTEVRLAAALKRFYSVELSPRFARLLEKLHQREPGVLPQLEGVAEPPEQQGSRSRSPTVREPIRPRHPKTVEAIEGPPTQNHGFPRVPPNVPVLAVDNVGRRRNTTTPEVPHLRRRSRPAPPVAPSSAAVTAHRVVAAGSVTRRTADRPPSLEQAQEVIDRAADRDGILDGFFSYARHQFTYAAMFVVHDDIAEGREASGDGATTQEVRRLAVPLDVPGAFHDVRLSAQPAVCDLRDTDLDSIIVADLRRQQGQPAVLLPLSIRKRVVLMLYGDRGGGALSLENLSGLQALIPHVSRAFERLILGRKVVGQLSRSMPPPATAPQEAGAPEPPASPASQGSAPPLPGAVYPTAGTQNPASGSSPQSARAGLGLPTNRGEPSVVAGHAGAVAPGRQPSVIVDMGTDIERAVTRLTGSTPDTVGEGVDVTLALGEAVFPVLVQRFPGPLWFDRSQPHRRLSRGRDVSAIARALSEAGVPALPYVVSLLDDADADRRFYATLLASEFRDACLVAPLGRRIFDSDSGTRGLALDVLKLHSQFGPEIEEALRLVRACARFPSRDPSRRYVAARALGEIRDAVAVPLLIDVLDGNDQTLTAAAHRSLVLLTRQDFGLNARRWAVWAEANVRRHRVEWLIDALTHAEEPLRRGALEELVRITEQDFGFGAELSRREREQAQRKYTAWWKNQGRVQFQPRAPV